MRAILEEPLKTNRVGIIGGSGLYDMEDLTVTEEVELDTPFGPASDMFMVGELAGREVVFLPRHGSGHRLLPSELPFRANIWGMKKLGVNRIMSVSAVGSMRENLHPCEVVFPDQFIDRTHHRRDTFFGDGIVAHIGFSDPVCPEMADVMADAAQKCDATVHRGGTYVCIEGPAFSTRAESKLYRSWDVDVIGMTNYQEAKLAREAEICYATMACITDYDCWREMEEPVTVEMLIENLQQNASLAQDTVRAAIEAMPPERDCACGQALKNSIITSPEHIPSETKRRLEIIVGDYLQ